MIKKTNLIQRLKYPQTDPYRAFGNGLSKGGLSDAAYELWNTVFSFDWMGAHEFETGALPEAIGKLSSYRFENQLKPMQYDMVVEPDNIVLRRQDDAIPPDERFYILAAKEHHSRAIDVIHTGIHSEITNMTYKRETLLRESLIYPDDPKMPQGWLELDNGFFFFRNYDMFDKTAELFSVAHKIPAPSVKSQQISLPVVKNQLLLANRHEG